jgi:ubiquinone/menaquinone biosynthesis C-methylase UbiE
MPDKQVDYDRIAPGYNRRFAAGSEQRGIAAALLALAEVQAREEARGMGRILEVGCGTGHWLANLRPAPGRLYGLDLSVGMLAQARSREERLCLARGRACELPFADACADLVYCVNAIHHFQRQRDFVFEARRLLRTGGTLVVAGIDPRAHRHRWYIYDYFVGTYETDLDRFPSWGTVMDWMVEAGFERIEWLLVEQIEDHKVGRGIFSDPFLQKDACSQLALLTDRAYAAGLRRIAAALTESEAKGAPITFATDLWLAMLVGRVGA